MDFHVESLHEQLSGPSRDALIVLSVGGWSFNSVTRELTATATFNNTGSADAFKVTLQRLTLWGTGPTFTGFRQVYMEPTAAPPFPRNVGTINAGANTTLQLRAIIPPEVTAIPRWSGTGTYYDAATGGTQFNL